LLFSVRYLLWCCAQHDGDHESTFPVAADAHGKPFRTLRDRVMWESDVSDDA